MSAVIEVPSHLQPLLPFETTLLEALSRGEPCQAIKDEVTLNEVRAELLQYLCQNSKISEQIPSKEIHLEGAYISGPLNLKNREIGIFLSFINCYFPDPIDLTGAKLQVLELSGSSIKTLEAPRLQVQFSLILSESENSEESKCRPFSASHEVILNGAVINGNLFCDGGQFRDENGSAFFAENIAIGNSFLLRRASIDGSLNIMGATIGGNLECDGLFIHNHQQPTIIAENIKVTGNVHLRTSVPFKGKPGSKEERIFISDGELRFNNAKISGNLDCERATFSNLSGRAFTGDGMRVEGAVLFRNFTMADGEVRFYKAQMSELDCTGGVFNNPDGFCFTGAYMNVMGAFKLVGASCKGRVSLQNARVTNLSDTYSSWPQEPGLLNLDGFQYDLLPFEPSIGTERLKWLSLQFPNDDWKMRLKRFSDRLYNRFQKDPSKQRAIESPYHPGIQPYEQLISTLKKMGRADEAITVQIAKNNYITRLSKGYAKVGRLFKSLVDYGYTPIKALVPIVLIIAVGAYFFQQAAQQYIITPTGAPVSIEGEDYPYPDFDPILYSTDVFLPIVDLHQEDLWIPNTGKPGGQFYMYYMTFHIMAGWFLTTLFVAAVTGLVKTE